MQSSVQTSIKHVLTSIKTHIKNKMRIWIDVWWLLCGFWSGFGYQDGAMLGSTWSLNRSKNRNVNRYKNDSLFDCSWQRFWFILAPNLMGQSSLSAGPYGRFWRCFWALGGFWGQDGLKRASRVDFLRFLIDFWLIAGLFLNIVNGFSVFLWLFFTLHDRFFYRLLMHCSLNFLTDFAYQ